MSIPYHRPSPPLAMAPGKNNSWRPSSLPPTGSNLVGPNIHHLGQQVTPVHWCQPAVQSHVIWFGFQMAQSPMQYTTQLVCPCPLGHQGLHLQVLWRHHSHGTTWMQSTASLPIPTHKQSHWNVQYVYSPRNAWWDEATQGSVNGKVHPQTGQWQHKQ